MIALAVCIIGLLVYLLADGKPSDAGRIAFAVGLAFTLLAYGGKGLL
jgi:hypothetical protein